MNLTSALEHVGLGRAAAALDPHPPCLSRLQRRLLSDFRYGLPQCAQPYAQMARELGTTEAHVIDNLAYLRATGVVKRLGPIFRHYRLGYSTFAAIAVPPSRMQTTMDVVGKFPEISNYCRREHHFNLWMVITAEHELRLRAVLRDVERKTGIFVLALPMLEDYPESAVAGRTPKVRIREPLAPATRRTVAAIRDGLPLVSRPYAALAAGVGTTETEVLRTVSALCADGTIKRWGVVTNPRALGFTSNAMAVWNVPDESVAAMGSCLARIDFVTLCDRRGRQLPDWPYNLYAFIDGRNHDSVITRIRSLAYYCGLEKVAGEILFERRPTAPHTTVGIPADQAANRAD